ncbi:sulfurtransferase FdhD [Salipiger pallidus]|uniref:Sulfur carrier protein FdhD n=1 Tax=Salipiger pallidus TaxID=1775170 RepID=A0A8J2ZIL7_9RHOB|nr:formate dehydrogenase accessory sulfurtransferase FdhD [Salipiger pallidus]GGG68822.1 sulfurtransferase FdhD [Salipiger pallidus]
MTLRSVSRPGTAVTSEGARDITRSLPEEVPVALVFDGSTQAVMMATPSDVADFALGFALSEEIVTDLAQVADFETVEHDRGIEARLWLRGGASAQLLERQRRSMGPTGCGLCGIDSLDAALRPLPRLPLGPVRLTRAEVASATEALRAHQPLHDQTRAVHAAGFLLPGNGIVLAREDVGRHNALDKLIGAMARGGVDASKGAIVLTSRVSVDMVQKAVLAKCPILIAVSAPTELAMRTADEARLTVAAFARAGGFDLYSAPERITDGASDVA